MLRPARFGKCRDSKREESVTNDFSQTVIEFGLGFILFMMFLTAAVTFGSSSKTPVAKPNGTKMFCSVFLNDVKKMVFFLP